MFENIIKFFKKLGKGESKVVNNSKDAAKERLHLVLMQDRANVSADFLELMKQEIIEVIKKYIDVDERAIDVRLTNKENGDGTTGAPALYANIPIKNIKNEARKVEGKKDKCQEDKIIENADKIQNKNIKDKQEENLQNKNQEDKKSVKPEKTNQYNKKETKQENANEKESNVKKEVEQKDNKKIKQQETKNIQNKTKEKVKSEN